MNGYTEAEIRRELLLVDEEVGLEIAAGNIKAPVYKYEVVLVGGSVFFI